MMQFADLTTHRIEGIAREGNIPFSVPLFSHIKDNLWMGGCPVDDAPEFFRFIISLYPWGKYNHGDHQLYTEARLFDDSAQKPDALLLQALVEHIGTCVSLGPTLVHCQAGLNRSGLLTALTLKAGGMKGEDAVALLREKRSPAVLCNRTFEEMVVGKKTLDWAAE